MIRKYRRKSDVISRPFRNNIVFCLCFPNAAAGAKANTAKTTNDDNDHGDDANGDEDNEDEDDDSKIPAEKRCYF